MADMAVVCELLRVQLVEWDTNVDGRLLSNY